MTRRADNVHRTERKELGRSGKPIKHGTDNAYRWHKCGCDACVEAHRLQTKRRRAGVNRPVMVPAVPITRRLRGLARMGYTMLDVSRRTGIHDRYLQVLCAGRGQLAHPDTARKVREACAYLASTEPPNTQANRTARRLAERKGWELLAAWVDIDNLDALPEPPDAEGCVDDEPDDEVVRRLLAGIKTPARKVDKDAAFLAMLEAGKSDSWISERLGMNALTVKKRRAAVEAGRATDAEEAA